MMMKPDWKDAPEWAQYVAMDSDGCWFWYECKPFRSAFEWHRQDNTKSKAFEQLVDWQDTLQERPERMPNESQSET